MMAILKLLGFAADAVTLKVKLIFWSVVIAVVLIALGLIHHSIIEQGRAIERQVIQARDNAAIGQADKMEADVRRCYAQGGTWLGFNQGGPRCDR